MPALLYRRSTYLLLRWPIAMVWLVNGLYCKVLNGVPRHQQIVAQILGNAHAIFLTKAIGVAEVFMAVWIISGFRSRMNVLTQIVVIGIMNIIEFQLTPGLLLFGRWNSIFALLFMAVIYGNEHWLRPGNTTQSPHVFSAEKSPVRRRGFF